MSNLYQFFSDKFNKIFSVLVHGSLKACASANTIYLIQWTLSVDFLPAQKIFAEPRIQFGCQEEVYLFKNMMTAAISISAIAIIEKLFCIFFALALSRFRDPIMLTGVK